ncbi:hypothetical protein OS125_04610 [Corynebacterium sp. P7003]|uniref:Uncharacterized protein n=1 Tax=Corynebacterium pygosceleis TaxID=2800406 RepID=A0ABT3WQJ5_9CORY|nr:hypothetical protein [Corynebacterium pygosceleis]MCX7444527.1 hypothetical protein [Corynebacterium pygosceleis]
MLQLFFFWLFADTRPAIQPVPHFRIRRVHPPGLMHPKLLQEISS